MLVTVLVMGSGCVSKSKYNELKSENSSVKLELSNLNQKYQEIQSQYNSLVTDKNALQTENAALQTENDKLTSDNKTLTAEGNTIKTELTDARNTAQSLQTTLSDLRTKYDGVNEKLSQINAVFPAKYFASKEELSNWLAADGTSDYGSNDPVEILGYAQQLQQKALNDGYIVYVNVSQYGANNTYFMIYCTAVVQDTHTLYFWDPLSDGLQVLIRDVTSFKWATSN